MIKTIGCIITCGWLAGNIIAKDERAAMPTPLMVAETRLVAEMMDTIVLSTGTPSIGGDEGVLTRFMASLDPLHLFFLEDQKESLVSRYEDGPHASFFKNGDLSACFEALSMYKAAVAARAAWIQTRLDAEWRFDTDETFVLESKVWPKSENEADERWQTRLKHEILIELLQDTPREQAIDLVRERYQRIARTASQCSPSRAQELFINAMLHSIDEQSSFYSSRTLQELRAEMKSEQVGIGAMLRRSPSSDYAEISTIMEGGPADRSGLVAPGSLVCFVTEGSAHVDAAQMSLPEVANLTAGPRGTTITLTLAPPPYHLDARRFRVQIERDRVPLQQARAYHWTARSTEGTNATVGVIDIPSFYGVSDQNDDSQRTVSEHVEAILANMQKSRVQAIVLDLRRNEGGLLDEAIALANLFVGDVPVVQLVRARRPVEVMRGKRQKIVFAGPLVLLLSRESAAASEIFADTLKHYGKAVLVGDRRTAGRGDIQQFFSLEDYLPKKILKKAAPSGAKLTIASFYMPSGRSVSGVGIETDIHLPSIRDAIAEWIPHHGARVPARPAINPASKPKTWAPQFVKNLEERSLARQNEREEFSHLNAYIEWLAGQGPLEQLSLNQHARIKRRDAAKAKQRAFDEAINSLPKAMNGEAIDTSEDASRIVDLHLEESVRIAIDAAADWKKRLAD